ncbi:hypothetical protein HPB48_027122 [Haemaphysalis longicornis]|uniref:FP protein C-terminal domain-containing protein n=1 Tax=Haemaphysalis longicornis TaxID=44386 RepID=A0A9J6HCF2_HAELO|nr:hypothetical protein HPB48_027122 [Haemaphysalis longicornis]
MSTRSGKKATDGADVNLKQEFDDFRKEMVDEFRKLRDSVKYCSDTCDEVTRTNKDVQAMMKEIKELTASNRALKEENHRLTQRVEELEQYGRSNNLEVKGVPDDQDAQEIILKMSEIVREPDVCHRVPTAKQNESNIIVRFVRREKRNSFLSKAKKMRITTTELGCTVQAPVYVNEHLTRQSKQLLGAAAAKKKQAGWKYAWVKDGKIFARREDKTPILRIRALSDVDKITSAT